MLATDLWENLEGSISMFLSSESAVTRSNDLLEAKEIDICCNCQMEKTMSTFEPSARIRKPNAL